MSYYKVIDATGKTIWVARKFTKYKKANGLKFKIGLEKLLDVLEFIDSVRFTIQDLQELTAKGIDEDSDIEEIEFLTNLLEEYDSSELANYVPRDLFSFDYDEVATEAKRMGEKVAREWQEEEEALQRWYYSTRL
jgi:hypothetical protein